MTQLEALKVAYEELSSMLHCFPECVMIQEILMNGEKK